MFPYLIFSDNSEAQHSSISIYVPSAGRSFMLEFLCWSSKDIRFGAFQIAWVSLGHLLFGFLFPGEIFVFSDLREDQLIFEIMDHDSDLLDACLVSWWIFSNNRRHLFRSGRYIFWTFYGSFDFFGKFCLLLCLCIILTWNPIDYLF